MSTSTATSKAMHDNASHVIDTAKHLVQLDMNDMMYGCAHSTSRVAFSPSGSRAVIYWRDLRLPDDMNNEPCMGLFPENALVLGME